jgi:hypothetical protein
MVAEATIAPEAPAAETRDVRQFEKRVGLKGSSKP